MVAQNLTQIEADKLIQLEKVRIDDTEWKFAQYGKKISIPLVSIDKNENFSLDLYRGKINFRKCSYQNRGRSAIVLVRIDFNGAPHRNPDGEEIGPNHLHIYREEYGDKWAIPIPEDKFSDMEDFWQVLRDFMRFCNIIKPPIIKREAIQRELIL